MLQYAQLVQRPLLAALSPPFAALPLPFSADVSASERGNDSRLSGGRPKRRMEGDSATALAGTIASTVPFCSC